MFGKKRAVTSYDPAVQRPVIRCSICTGEQVAGWQDIATGHFEEVQLLLTPQDLEAFRTQYGIDPAVKIEKIY